MKPSVGYMADAEQLTTGSPSTRLGAPCGPDLMEVGEDKTPTGSVAYEVTAIRRADAVHYYDASTRDCILSSGNHFEADLDGITHRFTIPVARRYLPPMVSRLLRRMLRLDKSNVALNHARDGLIILYRGGMWFYDLPKRTLRRTGSLRQCRNLLHRAIAVTPDGIFFGEYGSNHSRQSVPVWGSRDDGRSWEIVWETPQPCRHIHGVFVDPFGERLWIPTGDFDGECYLISASRDFTDIQIFGDGSQAWRPASIIFSPTSLAWVMDTQLETPFLQIFDRATGEIERHEAFPGPCWYAKQLEDGWAILQTTVEIGPGVSSKYVHLYASRDFTSWVEFARFKKDIWPKRLFKFGVVAFADGPQTSDDFVMFGEATSQMDGKAYFGSLRPS